MRWRTIVTGLIVAAALAACDRNPLHLSHTFLDTYAGPDPTPAGFHQCHGFGCAQSTPISLSAAEWQSVRAEFTPPAADPRTERRQITDAIALLERLVGARTGTIAHQWTRHDLLIWPNDGDPTQLDCIDEAVNTWTYMTTMAHDGLLRFHDVAPLSYAGSMFDFHMRNTAVLRERASGEYFAIDSSLVEAGERPLIMPLTVWLGDWPPAIADASDKGALTSSPASVADSRSP
ncbi:MAG TPA: hypothetical protein VET84_03360 [Stellaceae bacterium]|nr:hypothetical protein [Stellaceae bacterium]